MILKLIGIAAFLYSAYLSGVFFLQRQVLFPVNQLPRPPVAPPIHVPHEKIRLEMPFGTVEAWYLMPESENPGKPSPLVILAHGNGDLIDTCLPEAMGFVRMGMRALMVEYPGYGRSTGKPNQGTVTETFIAAYDRIVSRPGVDPNRILFYGRSLGGGAICQLAKQRPSAAMILVSTFTSVDIFARRFYAPGFLVRDRFDNLSVVKSYDQPILIIHGNRDDVVPYSHGKALSEAAKDAQLVTYTCGHNDMPPDVPVFWGDIRDFLRRNTSFRVKSHPDCDRIAQKFTGSKLMNP